MKRANGFGFLCLVFALAGSARADVPVFDGSGNGLLNGTYYYREVLYILADASGNLGRAISIYGNITFDGNGNYNITGSAVFDSQAGVQQAYPNTPGTYRISSTGYGYMDGPISNNTVYGLVSNGIFIGSSTEGGPDGTFNDLLVMAKVSSPLPNNASFKGTYTMGLLDFPAGDPRFTRDALFQVNADGIGNLGSVSLSGYLVGTGNTAVNQTVTGIKYFFSNGAANVSFPTPSQVTNSTLIYGTRYLYFSEDGNFVFGGSPTAWDMIIGFKNGSDAPKFNGLYYQAGIDEQSGLLDTFYGSLSATTGAGCPNSTTGCVRDHERILSLLSPFNVSPFNFGGTGGFNVATDGTYTDSGTKYAVSPGGTYRIGIGIGPSVGVSVAVKAPPQSGMGVFLDPTGVVNGATFAPFTAGIARGELISLFGTNLASGTVIASGTPFPTTLGKVQVMINGRLAPLYFVSPGQIAAIVPYATELTVAGIQVINDGQASNLVTTFVNTSGPGIFTKPSGGLGPGAILHQDFSLVTTASPAKPGETISIYLTGLADVTPAISDGGVGGVSPLNNATNMFSAFIDGVSCPVVFAGLAPQLAGLYQLNVTIASGITPGDAVPLAIAGPDAYVSMVTIALAGSSSAEIGAAPRSAAKKALPAFHPPPAKSPRNGQSVTPRGYFKE